MPLSTGFLLHHRRVLHGYGSSTIRARSFSYVSLSHCAVYLRKPFSQKFYWNGMKLINTNRIRVNAMQARVQAGGAPLSRWETRFIANYKQDALK